MHSSLISSEQMQFIKKAPANNPFGVFVDVTRCSCSANSDYNDNNCETCSVVVDWSDSHKFLNNKSDDHSMAATDEQRNTSEGQREKKKISKEAKESGQIRENAAAADHTHHKKHQQHFGSTHS